MLHGGCYCGAIRYAAHGPVFDATLCHCADCRRISGAPAVAWFSVRVSGFRYTRGVPVEFLSSPPVKRAFCGNCGTMLTYRHDAAPDDIDVTTCSLDQPELAPPQDHTWAASRVEWLRMADGLPVYPRTRAEGRQG